MSIQPLRTIDRFLNGITMYRLVLYGLVTIEILSIIFAFTGLLSLSGVGMIITFVTLVAVCSASNWLLGRFWPATTNAGSAIITALILGFILPQSTSLSRWLAVILAGVLAMASKYLLARYNKHFFNPAAFAALALGLAGLLPATWWIGSPVLLPFTLAFGVLLLRKLRRFQLFGAFLAASLAILIAIGLLRDQPLLDSLRSAFASSPLIFLGTIMLTEPMTLPPRNRQQIAYGMLVGTLFTSQLHLGRISATPELALIIGNLFSYAISPKYKLRLHLKRKTQLSARVYDFAFTGNRRLTFLPGQYMEWTLPVANNDNRGNRRSFTIASSPTEADIHLGIKFSEHSSSFKTALQAMQPGDTIMGGQLGGNFVLPVNSKQKLVFIAGGIGITPFRSMLQYMIDKDIKRDITLFYMITEASEISYENVIKQAAKLGVKFVPVLSTPNSKTTTSWHGASGYLTAELLQKTVPDYAKRRFYLSGPSAMVDNYRSLLRGLGLPRRAITTDHFTGY